MKKKISLILLAFIFIFLIFIILAILGVLNHKSPALISQENLTYPTAAASSDYEAVLPKQEIIPEFMTETDKNKLNLSTSTRVNPDKIQVLKRDSSGNIIEYKLINTDDDLTTSR